MSYFFLNYKLDTFLFNWLWDDPDWPYYYFLPVLVCLFTEATETCSWDKEDTKTTLVPLVAFKGTENDLFSFYLTTPVPSVPMWTPWLLSTCSSHVAKMSPRFLQRGFLLRKSKILQKQSRLITVSYQTLMQRKLL